MNEIYENHLCSVTGKIKAAYEAHAYLENEILRRRSMDVHSNCKWKQRLQVDDQSVGSDNAVDRTPDSRDFSAEMCTF